MRGVFRATIAALILLAPLGAGLHAQQIAVSEQTLAAAGPVTLTDQVRVALADPSKNRRLTEAAREGRILLVLDDLKAAQQPGVIYEVYLGLPPGGAPGANDPHYVGTLNFFAVAPPNTATRSRSYDVTDLARRLVAQGLPDGGVAVTIARSAQPSVAAATAPTIGRVALVAQ